MLMKPPIWALTSVLPRMPLAWGLSCMTVYTTGVSSSITRPHAHVGHHQLTLHFTG